MTDTSKDYNFLLREYRAIWSNRLLSSENGNDEEIVKGAINRELLDENFHPRIRKNRYEKYFYAVKKIINSPLLPASKLALIQLHIMQMGEFN